MLSVAYFIKCVYFGLEFDKSNVAQASKNVSYFLEMKPKKENKML